MARVMASAKKDNYMTHDYDPGYGANPFKTLCNNHPDSSVYPPAAFRVEWGPIFHRGRLDGSARLLVIGQDPAAHETILRRILVGEAGQRFQGFLYKLGIDRSYVMINTFLYSVYGQGGSRHKNDAGIIAYRNQWLNALLVGSKIEAVVGLGTLAEHAWAKWKMTPKGRAFNKPFVKITHPTFPESHSGGKKAILAADMTTMLANWNTGLQTLRPAILHPDVTRPLVLFGRSFQDGEEKEIPECDVPAGTPPWMRGLKAWATRSGPTTVEKRKTIKVTVPRGSMP
jgi:uracil-DNA glycosylase